MSELAFTGSGLSHDLEPYLKHLESIDAPMSELLTKNIASIRNVLTEENRKSSRVKLNGILKASLRRPDDQNEPDEGPSDEEEVGNQSTGSTRAGVLPSALPQSFSPRFFLTQLTVEGFRGIKNEGAPLVLKFDHESVNSIFAQNGTGKSSLYEALQYAIQGNVPRLASMQASEKSDDYLANLFHSTGEATITLTLTPDDNSPDVEIEVKRLASGARSVSSATNHSDPEGLLESLNQDFTLLDYSTFTRFIEDTALNRGRSFSSLLGLSDYANFRRMLKALENTQTFRGDFGIPELEISLKQSQKNSKSSLEHLSRLYADITKNELTDESKSRDWGDDIVGALRKVTLLHDALEEKTLSEIDFTLLREKVLKAEGAPERKRLETLFDQRTLLANIKLHDSTEQDAADLLVALEEHETLVRATQGEHVERLNAAAEHFLKVEQTWDDHTCPLCDSSLQEPIGQTVEDALTGFKKVAQGREALKEKILGSDFLERLALLEGVSLLETTGTHKHAAAVRAAAKAGTLTRESLEQAQVRLSDLEARLVATVGNVDKSINDLEKTIPPSLVVLTAQISAAQAAQQVLAEYFEAIEDRESTKKVLAKYDQWKSFITQAYHIFAAAEAELSNRTLDGLRAEYQQMFAEVMSAGDVIPELARPGTDEHMTVELTSFHGKQNVSARAVLSESYRNALAISVFLSAAASHTKSPRFIVLDDATSSFDSGHQYHLMEQIRTKFQNPVRADGLQFIVFSHDVALEKYFDRLDAESGWNHQKLQGWPPLTPVTTHGQNPDRLRSEADRFLRAGQVQEGAGLIRQYLEFVLQQIIKKVQIPVPLDLAVNDHQRMVGSCIEAIIYAVEIHEAANRLVLTQQQVTDLQTRHAPWIVSNWVSHYGTSGSSSFSPAALIGVLDTIDAMRKCFQYDRDGNGDWRFYKSLSKR